MWGLGEEIAVPQKYEQNNFIHLMRLKQKSKLQLDNKSVESCLLDSSHLCHNLPEPLLLLDLPLLTTRCPHNT